MNLNEKVIKSIFGGTLLWSYPKKLKLRLSFEIYSFDAANYMKTRKRFLVRMTNFGIITSENFMGTAWVL